MTITIPQFQAPFALDADGKPLVCQQDSAEDIQSCVYNILVCPLGRKFGDPKFGAPSPLFQTVPISTNAIVAAIRQLEPRATPEIIATGLQDQNVQVNVGVSATAPASQ